jgi:hypothetical protein
VASVVTGSLRDVVEEVGIEGSTTTATINVAANG